MIPCSMPGRVLSTKDTHANKDEALALREHIFIESDKKHIIHIHIYN